VPLVAGLGIPPITVDLILICISSVPIAGIAAAKRASAQQFILAYDEFVNLACADHQIPLATIADSNFDGAVEECVLEPIDNDFFKKSERMGDLPVIASA
jgi:hypothetical protein